MLPSSSAPGTATEPGAAEAEAATDGSRGTLDGVALGGAPEEAAAVGVVDGGGFRLGELDAEEELETVGVTEAVVLMVGVADGRPATAAATRTAGDAAPFEGTQPLVASTRSVDSKLTLSALGVVSATTACTCAHCCSQFGETIARRITPAVWSRDTAREICAELAPMKAEKSLEAACAR